ncbi:MAG: hypothetical protein ACI8XB_003259 [Patiriisocius sp.]|jgi:hypothetical protein
MFETSLIVESKYTGKRVLIRPIGRDGEVRADTY